jgi:hypothetical protein
MALPVAALVVAAGTFFAGFAVIGVDDFGDAQGLGVERRLRDKTIRKRDAEDTSNAGGQPEQEDIPVKTRWLPEWEFGSLGDQRRDCWGMAAS